MLFQVIFSSDQPTPTVREKKKIKASRNLILFDFIFNSRLTNLDKILLLIPHPENHGLT